MAGMKEGLAAVLSLLLVVFSRAAWAQAYTPGAAYNNRADNPSTATVWTSPTGRQAGFKLRANRSRRTGEAFVYIFGSIIVGSVPAGTYSGTYVMAVAYR